MSWSRESTTPMDFEYQNHSGPVDQNSPFLKAIPQQPGKKRSHVALESPSKNSFSTPNRPQLREPHSERYLFSQQSKPLPSIPSHVSSSWIPRTPPNVIDCSSGGETPNTPGFNDDSDAQTPDTNIERKMGRLMEEETDKSSKKGRRTSFWSKIVSKSAASPSPIKETKQNPNPFFSKKAETRVMKRRAKSTTRKTTVQDYDSDNEQHESKDISQQQPQPGMAMGLAGFFAWIEAHPNLPSVLSFYLQLLVNLFLGCGFMYMLYAAWSGIMNDVNIESHKSMVEVMVEIGACAKDYNANRCAPETRVPAMQNICSNWEKCMQRDPKKVARASVTARTFAMIFNSFVEEFSYKSMVFLAFLIFLSIFLVKTISSFTRWMRYDQPIFTAIIIFGGFNLSNWAFGLIRKQQPNPQQESYNYPPPPATPQRYPSGGYIDFQQQQQWQTPYQNQTPYGNQHMLQQASQSMPQLQLTAGEKEGRRSPSKRSKALA